MRENITLLYPAEPAFYKLTLPDGKYYVGSSKRLNKRLRDHRQYFESGSHHNKELLASFTNWSDVEVEYVIYQCLEMARAHEQEVLNSDYRDPLMCNVSTGVDGFWTGEHGVPQEVRNRISLGHKGKKLSPEHCEKIRRRMLGTRMSDEQKKKISASLKGIQRSEETKVKLRLSSIGKNLGRVATEKARFNMSKAQSGRVMPDHVKRKISEANFKKVHADGIVFASLQECAHHYGVTHTTVTNRATSNKPRWVNWWLI